jgi:predicted alpha/beta superfamily hydrolase
MWQNLWLITAALFSSASFSQSNMSAAQSKPLVMGEVYEIQSAILSEKRTLNIYLPEGYLTSDTAHFPVVYLLDGGTDEDFFHVCGLYQLNSIPWVGRVAPSIIVGIVNRDRKRDMTFPTTDSADRRRYPTAGHSDRFISFLETELLPYIRKKFRLSSSATLVGESLAGLLATEILYKKPALFNQYIIVSPSLWWDNGSLLKQLPSVLQNAHHQKTIVYIGVGKEGLTPNDTPRVMEVDANLLADNIRRVKNKDIMVYFDYLPQENHATIMHQALYNALRLLGPIHSD